MTSLITHVLLLTCHFPEIQHTCNYITHLKVLQDDQFDYSCFALDLPFPIHFGNCINIQRTKIVSWIVHSCKAKLMCSASNSGAITISLQYL